MQACLKIKTVRVCACVRASVCVWVYQEYTLIFTAGCNWTQEVTASIYWGLKEFNQIMRPGMRASLFSEVHQVCFPPTRTDFSFVCVPCVFLLLIHYLKGRIFQSWIRTMLLWQQSLWLTWNKLRTVYEMVCIESLTKWIPKQCRSNIWIWHSSVPLLTGPHLFIALILSKPQNGYLSLKPPEKPFWAFERRQILPLLISNINVCLLMLCDKLTPCITMYSEYTEMSKDIDTSEKKKKKNHMWKYKGKVSVPSQLPLRLRTTE